MFDHVGVHVSDFAAGKRFYSAIMSELGFELLQENEAGGGRWLVFGAGPAAPFFVVAWAPDRSVAPVHLAFMASSTSAVDSFHAAGLAAGGRDNGPPGPRAGVTPYYAAYLLDPDGLNVEAGFRGAQGPSGGE